jgi:hypothetical protein
MLQSYSRRNWNSLSDSNKAKDEFDRKIKTLGYITKAKDSHALVCH